jgi:acyl-CoA thioester hydrolase
MFSYTRQIQFYETDLMGIVHHSNYLRLCEEARVAWARDRKLITPENQEVGASSLAVLESQVHYKKPLRFGDLVVIEVQARLEKIYIELQYRILVSTRNNELSCLAKTVHIGMNSQLKPTRPSENLKTILENETWTETWL